MTKPVLTLTQYALNKFRLQTNLIFLGPIVQSIVSLTSSLVVKMLTVLVSTMSNSQVFFAEKKKKKKM